MNILRIMFAGVLVMGLFGNAIAELNEGLIADYPFDGNANNESGNGNDGTENGGVMYVTGKYGQAASFDGVNDWIIIQDMLHIQRFQYRLVTLKEYKTCFVLRNLHLVLLTQSENAVSNSDFTISMWFEYPNQTGGIHDYSAILGSPYKSMQVVI